MSTDEFLCLQQKISYVWYFCPELFIPAFIKSPGFLKILAGFLKSFPVSCSHSRKSCPSLSPRSSRRSPRPPPSRSRRGPPRRRRRRKNLSSSKTRSIIFQLNIGLNLYKELYEHSYVSVWRLFLLDVAAGVYHLPGLNGSCSSALQPNRKIRIKRL